MTKRYDQIINDAINEANKASKQTAGHNTFGSQHYEYESNPSVQAAVAIGKREVDASIHIAIAHSLDIGRRALRAYISEEAEPIHKDFERMKERFETLDGSRSNAALGQRAVRFDHIRSLENMPSQPKSRKTAAANPSKDDFNALFDDVRTLYNALFEVAVAIRSHGTSK